jgi:hypothetical protein
MQIILQATHGVVTGDPGFFKRAFGDSVEEFQALLLRPHHQIFNRDWYEEHEGREELFAFQAAFSDLSASDREELLGLLSSCHPREFRHLAGRTANARVRRVLPYYIPITKDSEAEIWRRQRELPPPMVPDDERVEDAGLDEDIMVDPKGGSTPTALLPSATV